MPEFDYDLFVIGGGSGGVRAARIAAGLGARVALAEERYLGGTCVNVGCVPKKLFVYASHFHDDFQDAQGYGWDMGDSSFHWERLRDNKDQEIQRLNGVYAGLLEGSGVRVLASRARLVDAHTLQVGDDRLTAGHIMIATGGWPFIPDIPGAELAISSNEIFHLENLPDRAVVVGGGYIAVEFAGILAGLGVHTDLVYRGDLFLRGFDEDVRQMLADEYRKKGIQLHFNTNITALERCGEGIRACLDNGDELLSGLVMYATGRKPLTEGLNLEQVGVECDSGGAVIVNERFQTSVPSIYALGDVIGRVALTPVALAEGMALARHLFADGDAMVDYDLIPTAVFCQPNIGTVGLTEAQARAQFSEIGVYRSSFRPMKHTLSGRDEQCLMKLIVDVQTDRVVGVHMVGSDAGEIIQGMAVALKAGATKAVFDQTIGIHPTAAEEFVTMREPVTD